VIDVSYFGEVVRPVGPAVGTVGARPPRRLIPARENGRDRREKIAPVEARRKSFGLPGDVEALRFSCAAPDEFEQAVARADIPPVIGLDDGDTTRAAL
jgi:hypothetical protein